MTYYPAICIIDIERVKRAVENFGERFLRRIFTPEELAYCEGKAARYQHLACRLTAKIAARQALREAGLQPPPWRLLEVKNDDWGKPSISCDNSQPSSIMLSLSHTHDYAISSVILTTNQ